MPASRRLSGRETAIVGEHAARHGQVRALDATLADVNGAVSMPLVRLDALARLQARGRITPAMRQAGEAFGEIFRRAQLDELRAADPGRVRTGRMHLLDDASESAERCRRRISEIVAYLGGSTSPASSVIWSVCGEQRSVRAWALAHNRSAELGCGVLVGALAGLTGFFAARRGRSSASRE